MSPGEYLKFADVSEIDLLGYMAMAEEDREGAQAAGTEFFRRHSESLFRIVRRWTVVDALGGRESGVVDDIVQETIAKAYKKAASFKPGRAKIENIQDSVRAWLSRIAWRVSLDMLSDATKEAEGQKMVQSWADAENETSESCSRLDSAKMALVEQAVEQLTERERTVLFTTMMYDRPGQQHQRVPNDIMADLARQLDTTSVNIRKIRERAKAKICSYVQGELGSCGMGAER